MADPPRRNLLAKLRGKKSKKGTPAGGYGAATNGGRAGKGKVSQNPDGQTRPVVMFAELHCLTDNIMRGNDSYVNGIVVNKVGLDQEQSTVGVVETSEFPQQYEASVNMHINTSRGPGDNQCSGCSGIRGRVNEELLGVSLQRATQYEGNDRDEMIRIHKQGPGYFSGQLQQGHIGRPHEQRKHFVPIPRQYSAGDSIGFGSNSPNNHIIYHRRPDGVVKMTNGHYPASKSNGTNVCFDKDLKTRVSHRQADDSCHQTVYNYKADNGQRSINDLKVTANVHPGHNQILKTNVTTNGTQMCPPGIPCAHHPDSNYTEENIVIRNIESYGSSPEFTGDNIRVTHLQSPTFFPTELEICEVNVASHFICAREGTLRHYSLDSEDDDYYDNVILPFYVSESLGSNDRKSSDKIEAIELGKDVPKGQVISDSAQETDRLRSQLKEAYYLLINTMHDISFDGQVSVNGFIDQASSSSHSRDSMCSRLSIKHMDSDAWSSEEHSVQQVSDTDSILLCLLSENRGDPSLKNNFISKSLVNLSASRIGPPLLRSTSDRAIKYRGAHNAPCVQALGSQSPALVGACENGDGASRPQAVGDSDPFEKQASYDGGTSSDDLLQDTGEDFKLNESSGSVNSLTGSSDNADTQQGGNSKRDGEMSAWDQGGSAKPHGVTVNKMQEWMHKGRLLSSEMKQRIAGSMPQPHGTHGGLDSAPWPSQGQASSVPGGSKPAALTTRVHGAIPAAVVPCQSQALHQSALIENVHSSYSDRREVGEGKASELSLWRPPLNTITVSKKRNWLQQSSGRPHHTTQDDSQCILGAEEENGHGHTPRPPPSPSPEYLKPPGPPPSRPLRLQLPQVSMCHARVGPQPRCVDPAEENDADDEGEIWYNPIPEDEEPELPHIYRPTAIPQVRLMVPTRPQEPQAPEAQRRPSREGGAGRTLEGCSPDLEGVGESLGGGGGEGSPQGNAVHSMEPSVQLHRQMLLTCKPQEEGPSSSSRATAAAEGPDLAIPGFSPPSSPNPAKKGSSLNWSFPDKIKSPRTVRKLSMKMKKLPELSRKLSVKGIPSNNNNTSGNGASASSQSETRTQCPKTNSGSEPGSAPPRLSPGGGQGAAASRNVISRYHLDSSVSTQQSYSKKKSSGTSMSASKGGYLSDGDSPELVAKSGKHRSSEGKGGKGKEKEKDPATGGGERTGAGGVTGGGGSSKLHGTELDIDAFRHYAFTEQPKCTQYISGLMSLHFYGAEDLKPPRVDSRDVYCAIQVDSVNKARTALLTCRTTFLDMDHTFNIELENAQHLKLVVFSWDPTPKKNRVCCHGTVVLPALFRVTRSHQLAVKLEPRGLIYVKLNLMEQWQNSLDGGYDGDRERQMFGVEAWRVVERENSGLMVPLLIEKCITEIEKRGCQVVGLYRLCGSAAVKKELREAFERDSLGVELCENTYPDINVITGVLKDYLRELPYPLITKHLYEAVLDSMAKRPLRIGAGGCENDLVDTEQTVSLLENLPEVERLTLRRLLDHLKLVASHHDINKMTCQNLAVCFGPVLLSQRQEASCHSNRVFIDSEELASALHFKKHIEVLHYLLQLWPVVDPHGKTSSPILEHPGPADQPAAPPLRRRKERPQVLNLSDAEMAGVLRPRPGRLDSPSNRYAGDWSRCGERYFPPPLPQEENDYDDVPSEDMEVTEEGQEGEDRGKEGGEELRQEGLLDRGQEEGQAEPPTAKQEPPLLQEVMEGPVEKEEEEREAEEERVEESDVSSGDQPSDDRVCDDDDDDDDERILPLHNPKEHTYQAYMKIQDISPVLSNRVNLRDLQESIDTLIGNLERELNKNNLKVSY
ncbi:rho GTPase-activating protein SYDE2 isoform X1 [Salmo salar]|uniref:Rho GTPase-activating protein SYDE2 isoform X1 n=1 Tax=Salmo salar TaxID=8030 RepID=A0A1S3KKI6_SALSA|nr:rho GTPase-activating protein SYDE2 isoform X1 [Salmo salar]